MKIDKLTYLAFLLAMLSFGSISKMAACSCSSFDEYFCHNVRNSSQNIYLITITDSLSHSERSMEIIEEIRITTVGVNTDTLIGSDGVNCGANLNTFAVGDTLVVALQEYFYSNQIISGCGRHYLKYKNGLLYGLHTPDVMVIDYEAFKAGINECVLFSSTKTPEEIKERLYISPNPATDYLELTLFDSDIDAIEIYDVSGKAIGFQKNIHQPRLKLDLSHLNAGIYIIVVEVKGVKVSRKFIVQ